MTGKTGDVKNEKITRLISSICDDTVYATSRGRIKHLTMGLGMKSITGARKVIDILNRMGHGIVQQPGLVTSLAWDNYDEHIETLSGCDTVQDTVGICYQNNPSGIQDNILTDTTSTTQETEHVNVEVRPSDLIVHLYRSHWNHTERSLSPSMLLPKYHAPSI